MLPKLPLRIEQCETSWVVRDDAGQLIDDGRCLSVYGWPIPDARQAAERRLAELTALIEAATPKCPIRKGGSEGDWWVCDGTPRRINWRTEAERDAVYDALVALWHKEHGQ